MTTPQPQMRVPRDSVPVEASGADAQSLPVTAPGTSLRVLLASSVGWAAAAKIAAALGGAFRYFIFARLLRPYDFGVFGAATFCVMLLRLIIDPSFEVALVAQDEDVHSFQDTVWTMMLIRAAVIAVILIAGAKPLAEFFKIPNEYVVFYAAAFLAFL